MNWLKNMTNATKAQIIAAINAGLVVLTSFGVVLSDAQTGGITLLVNAILSIWVGATYTQSPKRVPDA